MLNSALHGFVMGLSLIVPIGAQNAFVLKQGLKQQHVFAICLCCSISTQYPNTQLYFALGAITASFLFFFSLGYAARYLQPVFQRPQAWKILDIMIGCVMWSIAISLLK